MKPGPGRLGCKIGCNNVGLRRTMLDVDGQKTRRHRENGGFCDELIQAEAYSWRDRNQIVAA